MCDGVGSRFRPLKAGGWSFLFHSFSLSLFVNQKQWIDTQEGTMNDTVDSTIDLDRIPTALMKTIGRIEITVETIGPVDITLAVGILHAHHLDRPAVVVAIAAA